MVVLERCQESQRWDSPQHVTSRFPFHGRRKRGPEIKTCLWSHREWGHMPCRHLPNPRGDHRPQLRDGGDTQIPKTPLNVRKGWHLIFRMIFFLLNVDIWCPINKIENVNIVKLIREWFSVWGEHGSAATPLHLGGGKIPPYTRAPSAPYAVPLVTAVAKLSFV